MNNMRIYSCFGQTACLFIIFCLLTSPSYAQLKTSKTDSVRQLITNAKTDSDKIKNLIILSKLIDCSDTADKIEYALNASQLALTSGLQKGRISAARTLG